MTSSNGSGPEPELPIASTHDVNLLEVTHGMVPTVEPKRVPVFDGEMQREDGESEEEFSHRVARVRKSQLELRKDEEYKAMDKISPLEKFARAWEGPSNSGTETITGPSAH